MRASRGLGKAHVGAITAAGLIAMPIAALPGHSAPAPSTSATARVSASPSPRGTTTPSPPRSPRLSISVTDGQTAVKPGDQLTYLVSVQNGGMRNVPNLTITQTLPPGLKFVSASGHGAAAGGQVSWSASACRPGAPRPSAW